MLAARNSGRRATRPPAASKQIHHAPERARSATSCSDAAATRMPAGAACRAVAHSSRRRAITATSAAPTTIAPPAPITTRRAVPLRSGGGLSAGAIAGDPAIGSRARRRRRRALASALQARLGALVDALQLAQARRARRPRPVGLGAVEVVALPGVSRLGLERLEAPAGRGARTARGGAGRAWAG